MIKSWLDLFLPLIGREGSASSRDQSQSNTKKNLYNPEYFRRETKNVSNIPCLFLSFTGPRQVWRRVKTEQSYYKSVFSGKKRFGKKKYCIKALNDRSSCQTSSSFIAPRMYHYSYNSCMTRIFITAAITTTTECLFEGLFKLRIHYPIDDWIYKTTGEQQIRRYLSHFTWNVASTNYYKTTQGFRNPCN